MTAKDIKDKPAAFAARMPKDIKELLDQELSRLHELIKSGQNHEWAMKQVEVITQAIINYSKDEQV